MKDKILALLVVGAIISPMIAIAQSSGGANADTIYNIVLPPGIPDSISVSGTLTMDDNDTVVGLSDITAFSIKVSGPCGVYGSCFSQTMTASNAILSCNDCLVRTSSELSISPNYTLGLIITSDAENCGPSGNQVCAEVSVYTNHQDSEYFYTVCSSGDMGCAAALDGIAPFGDVAVAQAIATPEIDPTSAAGGLTLLLGGVVALRGRRPAKLGSSPLK